MNYIRVVESDHGVYFILNHHCLGVVFIFKVSFVKNLECEGIFALLYLKNLAKSAFSYFFHNGVVIDLFYLCFSSFFTLEVIKMNFFVFVP